MARRQDKKLTALEAKNLTKPGFHSDGAGLYLRIEEGRRLWVFRYKRRGVSRWLSLGPDRDVSLAQARTGAAVCRRQLLEGIDPMEARQAAKAEREELAGHTFQKVAEQYIAAHKAGWRNEKHGDQWEATLKAYAYPTIGEKPVSAVTVAHVLAILEPIWNEKPETASRVRGRIEAVLAYSTARKLRTGENPAQWKGHLDHLLPARAKLAKVEHHAAVAWVDLPAVMAKLAESRGAAAACLRFLTLTAARSGEARGARWDEIDLAGGVWTIPGERMKAGQSHRVPLSPAALVILRAAYPAGTTEKPAAGLVFPGGKKGSPLSDVAVAKALRTAGVDNATVHGMRSTFRDWAAERTNYPREISEAALAHTNKDKVEAAYLRGDHFEKRRRLMEAWADFATGPVRTVTATVTQLRAI
jgi:integrase